jgi:hypothetical protein
MAVYFTRSDATADRADIALWSEAFSAWLYSVLDAPLDERAAACAARIGRAHARRRGHGPKPVKARYLVLAIGFLMAAIAVQLGTTVPNHDDLARTMAAWNKLLSIELDLFLAGYSTASGRLHWY